MPSMPFILGEGSGEDVFFVRREFTYGGVLGIYMPGTFVLGHHGVPLGNVDKRRIEGKAVITAFEFASVEVPLIMCNALTDLVLADNTYFTKAGN